MKLKWKLQLRESLLAQSLRTASQASVLGMAYDLREFMLERFAEPKTGEVHWVEELDAPYQASAPGEYPAIKLGILANSITYELVKDSPAGVVQVVFGAKPYPGNTYGVANDPFYAEVVDQGGVTDNGLEMEARPYFSRAMMETYSTRPDAAARYFVAHFDRVATIRTASGPQPGGGGVLPPLGP